MTGRYRGRHGSRLSTRGRERLRTAAMLAGSLLVVIGCVLVGGIQLGKMFVAVLGR